MIRNIINWVLQHVFRISTQTNNLEMMLNDKYTEEYEEVSDLNFTSIFSNKLANYVINDSNLNVSGTNKRADYLSNLGEEIWHKMKKITSMGFGYGGVMIVPYFKNGEMQFDIIPQNRFTIDEIVGEKIKGITILAEQKVVNDFTTEKFYLRWANYKIKNNTLVITQKYTDQYGKEIEKPYFWDGIPETQMFTNVDRVLVGYIKSPVNNRHADDKYGAPITFGCDETIEEIKECLLQIREEFELKKAFVGVDYTMFKKDSNGNEVLPSSQLFKKFNSDSDNMWELFSPDIRQSSYYERLKALFSLLEKQIGTSAGILTELETKDATATAIRRAMYDTFTIVDDMRANIEKGLNDLFYAFDVIANAYKVAPAGTYELSFDWSYQLLEDSTETFNQLTTGNSLGVVKDVEIRQFLFPSETLEESQKAIDEISAEEPNVDNVLNEDQEDVEE